MKHRTSPYIWGLVLLVGLGACGSVEEAPEPEPEPETVVPPPVEEPLPRIAGDAQIPERFRKDFGEWLRDENPSGIFERVVAVREVDNALSILLERKIEMDGTCRVGPSTLEIIYDDAGQKTVDIANFGEDCCPGSPCDMVPDSWNLRYLRAVDTKDLEGLAQLVPARKKLTHTLVTPEGKTKKSYTRKDIAAGKLVNPPGCSFIDTRPSCTAPDEKTGAFRCMCDGGGYHVTYDWVKEKDGFVIAAIEETSS